jgi:hypothetical protein
MVTNRVGGKTTVKQPSRWLKRTGTVLFGCILFTHVAVKAFYYPIIMHDWYMAQLKTGDSRETMIRLVGAPGRTVSLPDGRTVCDYTVFPWVSTAEYRHYRLRSRWQITLDDADRVVSKNRLSPYT